MHLNLPHLASRLEQVEHRLADLRPVVRDHVYHPGFAGSFSLKSVAPVMAPEVSYQGLEIADGGTASHLLHDLLLQGDRIGEEEKRRVREGLLAYCRTDTLAVVEIHRALVRCSSR